MPGAPCASDFLSTSLKIRLPTHNLDPMGLGQMRLLAMGTGRRDSETAGFTIRCTVPKRRSLNQLPHSRKNSKIVPISLRFLFLSSL